MANKKIKQIKVQDVVYDIDVANKDTTPVEGSKNVITSGGVHTAFAQLPIVKGAANNSAVLAGSYQGYSNEAISQISVSLGAASKAGLKGWYYSKVDFANKKILLSKTKPTLRPSRGTIQDSEANSNFGAVGFAIGDVVSIVNDTKYDKCSTIRAINKNIITLDSLPFSSIENDIDPNGFSIFCPDKYNAGGVDLGGASFAEGVDTRATNIGAHAEGGQTHAYGQFSHAEGFGTKTAYAAHAEGRNTHATGTASHAEGIAGQEGHLYASALGAHAEGVAESNGELKATNMGAHAEGVSNGSGILMASGVGSHAEGVAQDGKSLTASGYGAHAEGVNTTSSNNGTHAEGIGTQATANGAHAEGQNTQASVAFAHAEGESTVARGQGAHAEGQYAKADSAGAHAEGSYIAGSDSKPATRTTKYYKNKAAGDNVTVAGGPLAYNKGAHAEGIRTFAGHEAAHAEGIDTDAVGEASHAEGKGTVAKGNYTHAEGHQTKTDGHGAHAEGTNRHQTDATKILDSWTYDGITINGPVANGTGSHAEGVQTLAKNYGSHSEGIKAVAAGVGAHAEGSGTVAKGENSHAEGKETIAEGNYSHTEGYGTHTHSGDTYAHAEGYQTASDGVAAHAEGYNTWADANGAHAEGSNIANTQQETYLEGRTSRQEKVILKHNGSEAKITGPVAYAKASHAEGVRTLAYSYASHAEGLDTEAHGVASHAAGIGTTATGEGQTVVGTYNKTDGNKRFIVGNGTEDSLSNAFEVDKSGDVTVAKNITFKPGTTEVKAAGHNFTDADDQKPVVWDKATSSLKTTTAKLGGADNWSEVVISDDFKITQAFGKYVPTAGSALTVVKGSDNKTLKDLFMDAFYTTKNPTVTSPSFKLETGTITTNSGNCEIGSSVTEVAWDGTFSSGSYEYGPATGVTATYEVSCDVASTISGNTVDGTVTFDNPVVITGTSNQVIATVKNKCSWGASTSTPINNVGEAVDSLKIGSGSSEKSCSFTVSGYREGFFYGTTSTKTATADLNGAVVRGRSKTNAAYTAGSKDVTVPVGAATIILACPADKTGVTKVYNNTVNADMTSSFVKTPNISVGGADATSSSNGKYAVNYNVWTFTPNEAYSTETKLTITLG